MAKYKIYYKGDCFCRSYDSLEEAEKEILRRVESQNHISRKPTDYTVEECIEYTMVALATYKLRKV